jgi:hypothetical protein
MQAELAAAHSEFFDEMIRWATPIVVAGYPHGAVISPKKVRQVLEKAMGLANSGLKWKRAQVSKCIDEACSAEEAEAEAADAAMEVDEEVAATGASSRPEPARFL